MNFLGIHRIFWNITFKPKLSWLLETPVTQRGILSSYLRLVFIFDYRVTSLSDKLGVEFGIIYPIQSDETEQEDGIYVKLVGNVENKIVWIIDDMIDDIQGYLHAVNLVKASGAKYIAIACVHALLDDMSLQTLIDYPSIDLVKLF